MMDVAFRFIHARDSLCHVRMSHPVSGIQHPSAAPARGRGRRGPCAKRCRQSRAHDISHSTMKGTHRHRDVIYTGTAYIHMYTCVYSSLCQLTSIFSHTHIDSLSLSLSLFCVPVHRICAHVLSLFDTGVFLSCMSEYRRAYVQSPAT